MGATSREPPGATCLLVPTIAPVVPMNEEGKQMTTMDEDATEKDAAEKDSCCNVKEDPSPEPITITVYIGKSAYPCYINESLLIMHSEYFRAALSKDWKENLTKTVTLPGEEVPTFNLYNRYLQSSRVCTFSGGANAETYRRLAKLYVLGERLMDDGLQDRIIDSLRSASQGSHWYRSWIRYVRYLPDGECIDIIYRGTPEGCGARRFLVDLRGASGWSVGQEMNADFVAELAVAVRADRGSRRAASRVDGSLDVYYRRGKSPES